MHLKSRVAIIFNVLFALIILLCANISAFAENSFIITDVIPDNAGAFVTITGKHTGNASDYRIIKLSNPERIVIDIPNAKMTGLKRSFSIANSGVTNIKIAQFSSNPDIVRLVFTAESRESLGKLSFHKSENSLIFKLNSIKPYKALPNTVYQDAGFDDANKTTSVEPQTLQPAINLRNAKDVAVTTLQEDKTLSSTDDYLLTTATILNNQLTISGTGSIKLKEPVIIQSPTRLVYDIPDAKVFTPDVLKSYTLNNTDIVRIGQFDKDTVRVVIETDSPDSYKAIMSPDLQSLVFSQKSGINLSELPDGKNVALIQSIDVKQVDKKTTTLTLTANKPIIHSIKRNFSPNLLTLDMFNVTAPKKTLITALTQTDQFKGIDIVYIEKYPGGSSWKFSLDRGIKVESKLGFDGKILELSLINSKINNYSLPSKARVVVDPGHGGGEPGAIRVGVYEKNITLQVTKKVADYLNNAGIDVIMTREQDNSVSLKERVELANSQNPDIFVSIHVNECNSTSIKGIETHWYTPQSLRLAKTIQKSLANSLSTPDRGTINSMFYVIHHPLAPSVLIETGFISNESERCMLVTEQYQDILAKAISNGILDYLNIK